MIVLKPAALAVAGLPFVQYRSRELGLRRHGMPEDSADYGRVQIINPLGCKTAAGTARGGLQISVVEIKWNGRRC